MQRHFLVTDKVMRQTSVRTCHREEYAKASPAAVCNYAHISMFFWSKACQTTPVTGRSNQTLKNEENNI